MLNIKISETVFVHLYIIFDYYILLWGIEKKQLLLLRQIQSTSILVA